MLLVEPIVMKWPNYARLNESWRRHHIRFVRRIEGMSPKLICQECRGGGGRTELVLDDGSGPWEECGFCEGTGYVTPWLRGQWLRLKKAEKCG